MNRIRKWALTAALAATMLPLTPLGQVGSAGAMIYPYPAYRYYIGPPFPVVRAVVGTVAVTLHGARCYYGYPTYYPCY